MDTDLHVVALVVVAALSEQTVVDHIVDIELIQEWVAILDCVRRVGREGESAQTHL